MQINTQAIAKLRDRLLETGGPPSVLASGPDALANATHPLHGDDEAMRLFDATFEAMFIMVSADGAIAPSERDTLRGAIRELTSGAVRTAHIEKMSGECETRLAKEGPKARLRAISEVLKAERAAAEAAFVLAAAMAFADDEIADEENEMLNEFADLLDIEGDRANQLLDELEQS